MARGGVGARLSLIARVGAVGGCCLMLAQCSQAPGKLDPKYGVSASPRLVGLGEPVPKGGGRYSVGKPYTVGGRVYSPEENPNYSAEGLASWYGDDFHGRQTANGEIFDMQSLTAAHPTLPIPSYARVTNLTNNKSVIVRVNDRGPYHANRLIDVSVRTARMLGFYDNGVTRVRVDYVGRAALGGSDDERLAATLRTGTPAPGPSEVRVASSRPFLPNVSDPVRGDVPVPSGRPFELGHDESSGREPNLGRVARRAPATEVAVTRQPLPPVTGQRQTAEAVAPKPAPGTPDQWERGFAARFAPARNLPAPPAETGPASAFSGPVNGAAFSGRGLY